MATDPATGLPAYIRSTDHHPYFRDVTRQTNVSDYVAAGGLMLPSKVDVTLDEFALVSLQLTAQEVNGSVGDLSAPAEAASAAPITGSAPANVTAEAVADGVWFLAGQSHHSVLIEFIDHLMVVEAPNEIRTLAVLEKAAELVPGKPIRYLVNTHHHFDHSGGIRSAVSAGLTIVTHAENESFFRRMAEQPSVLVPDALSRQPQAIDIETVEDARIYEDESMRVELHHVAGNPHSSSMLMAYLPAQKIIIEADAFSPNPGSPQRYAPNMLDNIQRLGLEIDRIVPIHGGIGDFAGLEAHVAELRAAE
jgi:glyoxylase-like metal-dependent hydrolase (beta-lactamase superfamily II)